MPIPDLDIGDIVLFRKSPDQRETWLPIVVSGVGDESISGSNLYDPRYRYSGVVHTSYPKLADHRWVHDVLNEDTERGIWEMHPRTTRQNAINARLGEELEKLRAEVKELKAAMQKRSSPKTSAIPEEMI